MSKKGSSEIDNERGESTSQSTDNKNNQRGDPAMEVRSMLAGSDSHQQISKWKPDHFVLNSSLPDSEEPPQSADESIDDEHSESESQQNAVGGEHNQYAPIPYSPLVTPPIGSNTSPQSPRTNNNYLNHFSDPEHDQAQQEDDCGSSSGGMAARVTKPATHGFYATNADFGVDAAVADAPAPALFSSGAARKYKNESSSTNETLESSLPQPPSNHSRLDNHRSSSNSKSRGIPHVYHDYAQVSGPEPSYVRKKTGGVTKPFPEKLHEMLYYESSDDPSSAIVSWLPHGRAFIVRRPKEFTGEIMPKYFRQTKLTSFQRQLNLYGFRRITQGADAGAYYHEMFLQGKPSLSQRMVRQKVKGTGHKQPADVRSEPNFYAMPRVEPDHYEDSSGARHSSTFVPPPSVAPIIPNSSLTMPTTKTATMKTSTAEDNDNLPEEPSSPISPPQESMHAITSIPGSPGFASAVNAAHLLRGFASSFSGRAAFLGPSAAAPQSDRRGGDEEAAAISAIDRRSTTANNSSVRAPTKASPASYLPPREQQF